MLLTAWRRDSARAALSGIGPIIGSDGRCVLDASQVRSPIGAGSWARARQPALDPKKINALPTHWALHLRPRTPATTPAPPLEGVAPADPSAPQRRYPEPRRASPARDRAPRPTGLARRWWRRCPSGRAPCGPPG